MSSTLYSLFIMDCNMKKDAYIKIDDQIRCKKQEISTLKEKYRLVKQELSAIKSEITCLALAFEDIDFSHTSDPKIENDKISLIQLAIKEFRLQLECDNLNCTISFINSQIDSLEDEKLECFFNTASIDEIKQRFVEVFQSPNECKDFSILIKDFENLEDKKKSLENQLQQWEKQRQFWFCLATKFYGDCLHPELREIFHFPSID